MTDANIIINGWPNESKEATKLVIDKYGEPDEASEAYLFWRNPGPWKRIIAYKDFDEHKFPAPHIDCIESFISYDVPAEKAGDLIKFDGSVVVNRTRGEMSARCHDEEANFLALNLAYDIVIGERSAQDAREYYAHEFLAYRKQEPAPYMEGLKFEPQGHGDSDERVLSDEDLAAAVKAGEAKSEIQM